MWVITTECKTDCATNFPLYTKQTFKSLDLDAELHYGDSQTGTHAFGAIGTDTVSIAGLSINDQSLAAVDDTNTGVLAAGAIGIFGLSFTINSFLWSQIFKDQYGSRVTRRLSALEAHGHTHSEHRRHLGNDFHRPTFPSFTNLSHIYDSSAPSADSAKPQRRQSSMAAFTHAILDSFSTTGPLLTRLIQAGRLSRPMFTVSLQRNTIEIGGNVGQLSIGELPEGISEDNITWVPLRAYSVNEGGLQPPIDSPNEQYPIAWEVFIDDVYLDGEKLARSTLTSSSIRLSALLDTGNSLMRGPEDVVGAIKKRLGGKDFVCDTPHVLAFEIGGKMFQVDPRDLISPESRGSADGCVANLAVTDPPVLGQGYLYSWSLGDPFLKG